MTPKERALALQSEIETRLPDFAKAVRGADALVFHQDSFAAEYQDSEYELLGKAIKYAGLFGREVSITGRNRTSLQSG